MKAIELKIPPAAQFLIVMAGMWLLAKYVPALSVEIPGRKLLVALLFCLSGIVAVPAIVAFRSAGTTVDPRDPDKATRLVDPSAVFIYETPSGRGVNATLWSVLSQKWLHG